MPRLKTVLPLLIAAVLAVAAAAKDKPPQVLFWLAEGKQLVRFEIATFKKQSTFGTQQNWTTDVSATNLWNKPMTATFSLFLFDGARIRVGEGHLQLNRVNPGETVRFPLFVNTIGTPVSLAIEATSVPEELGPVGPPHEISMTVYSVPSGAALKVDGKDVGTTPVAIKVTDGKHELSFSAPGYQSGKFPLVVTPEQASGGTISFEMGGMAHDTIEIRDGTVLTGDLEYMTATEVVVRAGGNLQKLDRNSVKRILLVQRDAPVPQ